MGWKSVRKGTNVNEAPLLPEKNRERTAKEACKSMELQENHAKGLCGLWANQITIYEAWTLVQVAAADADRAPLRLDERLWLFHVRPLGGLDEFVRRL